MSVQSFTSQSGRSYYSLYRLFAIVLIIISLVTFFATACFAQWKVTTLYSFPTPEGTSGGGPASALVEGPGGNLYGAQFNVGNGALFEIAPDGAFNTIYSFDGGVQGTGPNGLVFNTDGYLYGASGGGNNGAGLIFRINSAGNFTTLYKFSGPYGLDGYGPGLLVRGPDGNFYGETGSGGGTTNVGTIFRITPQGTLTTLYTFTGGVDGGRPGGKLTLGNDGAFYGVTGIGGTYGYGDIFRITSTGDFSVVHSFPSGQEQGGFLVLTPDGSLYGTTFNGGANDLGSIFRLMPDGAFTTIYSFTGQADGGLPNYLVLGSDAKLYGTSNYGDGGTNGTIFQVTAGGEVTTLYTFAFAINDAPTPFGIVQAIDSNFYGGTEAGGSYNAGSVFEMSSSLPDPATHFTVNAPSSATAGQPVLCTVTALDRNGNTATTYPGTVYITSSDLAAVLPPTATFTNGTADISVALKTGGNQTIYVADTTTPTVNGTSAAINVVGGDMHAFNPGLQLFSAPADFSGQSPSQIFSLPGITLAVWEPSKDQYAVSPDSPADTVRPGVGYWARFPGSTVLYDIGQHTNPSAAFDISLQAGWNMIGDPFATSVPLTSLQVTAGTSTVAYSSAVQSGLLGADIYTYPAGASAYQVESSALQPYVGYWVLASKPCMLIVPGS